MAPIQKLTPNAGKNVEEHSITGGSATWLSLFGKTVLQFFMELNIFVPYNPAIISLVFTQRRWKCMSTKKPAHGYLEQLHS